MINKKGISSLSSNSSNSWNIKIICEIGSKKIEEDVEQALSIPTVDKLNPTVLSNMMAENPSLHARWNFMYNDAVFEYDILKTKYEVWEAKTAKEIRTELSKIEKGRVTDKMVDEEVKRNKEYERLNEELALAKKNMKHILSLANGFGERGEQVVNIASLMKWEGQGLEKSRKAYSHIDRGEKELKVDRNKNDGWPI